MDDVKSSTLNGPLEFGLRALSLLSEACPKGLDMQRLVVLDYLLVHSGDIEGGPPSLHPSNPLRAGEISVRRALIEDGLHLLACRGLISRHVDGSGITYLAEELAAIFLDAIETPYGRAVRNRASWAIALAGTLSDTEASALLEGTLGRWKSEIVIDMAEELV